MKKKKKPLLILIPDAISIEEKLYIEMNVKVNFCGKAKLIKTNNIYYEASEKDSPAIKNREKSIENSLRRFDYLPDSRN